MYHNVRAGQLKAVFAELGFRATPVSGTACVVMYLPDGPAGMALSLPVDDRQVLSSSEVLACRRRLTGGQMLKVEEFDQRVQKTRLTCPDSNGDPAG